MTLARRRNKTRNVSNKTRNVSKKSSVWGLCRPALGWAGCWTVTIRAAIRAITAVAVFLVTTAAFAQEPEASGETYTLAIGEQVSRRLVASEDATPSTITYHTYVVSLNTPVNELTISVDGGGDDVDLVTQPGTPITRFAQASYRGLDAASQHRFSYLNPPVGEIYIDVVNKTAAPVGYVLTVTADLPARAEAPTDDASSDSSSDPSNDPVATSEQPSTETPADVTQTEAPTETETTPADAPETDETADAANDIVTDTVADIGDDTVDDTVDDTAAETATTPAETAADTATDTVNDSIEDTEDDTVVETVDEPTAATAVETAVEDATTDTAEDTTTDAANDPLEEADVEDDVGDIVGSEAGTPVLPTGTYGALEVGESVTARIVAASGDNGLSYHTYIVNVPADVPDVTISVSGSVSGRDGEGGDVAANIDLVTNAGEVIGRFSEADFSGISPNSQEPVAYADAAGLQIYIDVVNRQEEVLEYTLNITVGTNALFTVRDGVLRERDEPTRPVLDTAGVVIPSEPLPDGTYGMVPIGNTVTATIAPAGSTGFAYNTYLVEVTEALDDLVVQVDVIDVNGVPAEAALDLVVQQGAIIEDYDTADYNSFATNEARFAVASPLVGAIYYLDVVNLSGIALPYRLSVETRGPVVTSDRARDQAAASSASVVAPSRRSSFVGDLSLGQQAYGELRGKPDVATFHTYVIDVPLGTDQLELVLRADQDLDIAVQAKMPISDYMAPGVNLANSLRRAERLRIEDPVAGRWYIDVINGLGTGVGSYTLEVR